MSSLKETQEALAYGFVLAKLIKPELKDGFQPKDIVAILDGLLKPENVEKLQAAIAGADKIDDETSEMGFFGGLALVKFVLDQVKALQAV